MKQITLTKIMLAILMSIIMVLGMTPLAVVYAVEGTGTKADSVDPFADIVQQEPEGYDKTDSPYGTLVGETFNILKKNELFEVSYNHKVHSLEKGENSANYEMYDNDYNLHFVKSIAFDPTGSGQKDHVACIGYNWSTGKYEVYVVNAETGLCSARVNPNPGGGDEALFMKNLGVNSQGEYSHFHDITAGDYDGDGKETFIVHATHLNAYHMDYEFSASPVTDSDGNVTEIRVGKIEQTPLVYNPQWENILNQSDSSVDVPEPKNVHGTSYATGDFDHDGIDDLAVLTYALDPAISANSGNADDYATQLTIVLGYMRGERDYGKGVLGFSAERYSTRVLIEQNDISNPAEGDTGVSKTVSFPSVTAGDVDGDGVDEAIVSGYTVDLSYTYVNDEETLSRRLNQRMLNTGVIIGVYDVEDSELVTASLKHYNDMTDKNVSNPIMNNLSQVIAYTHGMPWTDPDTGLVYRYSTFYIPESTNPGISINDAMYEMYKTACGYDFADFDYNNYDKDHTIIPQFKTATVAINGAGSSEYIFLNGSLVRYDEKTKTIVHEYTPQYTSNNVTSVRELITYATTSDGGFIDLYDYVQSVAVGTFADDGTDREQVVVSVDSRKGAALKGSFGNGQDGYNIFPVETADECLLFSESYFISGAAYSDVETNDGETMIFGKATEYTINDPEKNEEVFYTGYGQFYETKDENFEDSKNGEWMRLWQNYLRSDYTNHTLTAVDFGRDGLVGRYVGKEYAYADPEIIAVLQAAPYYKDLGYYGGETEYTITRSYTQGKTGSAELTWNIGFATEVEAGCVQSETEVGYTSGWTEEFEKSIEKTYSITFTATSQNAVAMVRTPVIMYRFQLMDKEGNWLSSDETGTDMTIAIPSQPVYTTVSVSEYNNYVDYYNGIVGKTVLNKIESEELLNNEGDPSKYRVNWDYDSTVDHDNGVAFGEMFNESKFNMDGSIGVSFAENQTITSGLSNSSGFYFEETLYGGGDLEVIPVEIWAGVSAGVEGKFTFGTYASRANGTESSGTVAHVGNATGISLDKLSNYGFTWQFGTWNLQLDNRALDPQKDEPNIIPVFGYVVKRAKTVPNAPENLEVSKASGGESEAVNMTWDAVDNATYNVYKVENEKYTLLASGITDTNYTFTIPDDDPALFYNFTVTAVENTIESMYSDMAIYYRTVLDSTGIASIEKTGTDGLVDTYTITYTDGSTSTFTVTNGADGIQGIQGEKGENGHSPVITIQNGYWYIDGVNTNIRAEGLKGDTGNGISAIEKTGTEGLVDTYTITYTDGTTTTFTITNGEKGEQGEQGIQGIQGEKGEDGHSPVITIQNGYWYIDGVNTNIRAEGLKGDTGNGISAIEKTGTNGLVDTYTITFTDGSTTTFTVTNGADGTDGAAGVGIEKVEKTGSEGNVDTYTITLTNGNTFTFTVTNGTDGKNGITPQLRINAETNEWEVSYDNGETWTSLGMKAAVDNRKECNLSEKIIDCFRKIISFFNELFGWIKTFSCGVAHY